MITEKYREEKFALEDKVSGSWAIQLNQFPDRLKKFVESERIKSPHLDVGCHVGHFLFALARRGISQLYGIDASRKALEYAEKYAQDLDFRVRLHHGLVQTMPYGNEVFGSISCFQLLEGSESGEHLHMSMKEMWRVLKPHGWLIISIPYSDKFPHSSHIFRWRSLADIHNNLVMDCRELYIEQRNNIYIIEQKK